MRISWNWLREWVDLTRLQGPTGSGPADLAELLTSRGLEVESIERQDQGFDKVVSAQILERLPHPQADRLSLCKVSIGTGEPLEIVCGAQNMKAGDKVVLAQIGAHLPNDLKIEASKIRGIASQGMLCSEQELKLKDKSEGILILPEETPLGRPLAEILGRDDILLHLKLTPNRGDCLSHLGVAREVAAALQVGIKLPSTHKIPEGTSPISVFLDVPADSGGAAPQFYGCFIEGVKVGPSPLWVQHRLESLGIRSINNVVDASNLVMLELGQPVHAYDADKIKGQEVHVREAKEGESLPLLDGATLLLEGTELIIADRERPIALAGVMGGGNSEVQEDTQNLFLECAEFNPLRVRRMSSRYQRRTEAAQRFEKGIDPQGLSFALGRFFTLVLDLAGGRVKGSVVVRQPSREASPLFNRPSIRFGLDYFHHFLGFKPESTVLTHQKTEALLLGLQCQVLKEKEEWVVTPPSFRLDLNLKEDLAEEVARCLGYDQIPSTLPILTSSPIAATSSVPRLTVIDRAKEALVQAGLNESLNFSFTSKAWLKKMNLQGSASLLNPLSEEHEVLVPSLLPGLVRNAMDNWSHHFGSEPLPIRLFELRPSFSALGPILAQSQTETGVKENWKLSWILAGPRYSQGLRNEIGEVDFSDLKAVVEHLFNRLGTKGVRWMPLSASRKTDHPLYSLFHPGQSAEIWIGPSLAGHVGLLHPSKAKELKTRTPLWMAELDWEALSKLSLGAYEVPHFKAWAAFPSMERDFALLVKKEVSAEKICQIALKYGKPLAKSAKIFDIYRGSQVAEGMTSVAVRVIFYNETRSLQEVETEEASTRIIQGWKKELGVELRGE